MWPSTGATTGRIRSCSGRCSPCPGFGLLMIYSATRSAGSVSMERQMIFVAAGLTIYLIVSNIDYREYKAIIPWISVAVLIALLAVYVFEPVNGAQTLDPARLLQAATGGIRQGRRDRALGGDPLTRTPVTRSGVAISAGPTSSRRWRWSPSLPS